MDLVTEHECNLMYLSNNYFLCLNEWTLLSKIIVSDLFTQFKIIDTNQLINGLMDLKINCIFILFPHPQLF